MWIHNLFSSCMKRLFEHRRYDLRHSGIRQVWVFVPDALGEKLALGIALLLADWITSGRPAPASKAFSDPPAKNRVLVPVHLNPHDLSKYVQTMQRAQSTLHILSGLGALQSIDLLQNL